jgi:protein-tyrosine-phosphatase
MSRVFNVLFLCTHNSARSVLAEVYLNARGRPRFAAYSAGSAPSGRVNPVGLRFLAQNGYSTAGLRSKSWDEFALPDAPQMDFVITVCDSAAGETCPIWPGHPVRAHWGVQDPSAVQGTDEERLQAFGVAYAILATRIDALLALPVETLDRATLAQRAREIGRLS